MKKTIKHLLYVIAIAYLPCLLILSIFPQANDGFGTSIYLLNLLFFFVYSIPFFCAFLEIGHTLMQISDKREYTIAEKIIWTLRVVIVVGILLTLIDIKDLLYIALILSVLLIAFWIVTAVMFRKEKVEVERFKTKAFWLCVAAVIVVVIGIAALIQGVFDSQNKPDPLEGGGNSEITGSIVYFFGDDEYAISTFSSTSNEPKEIALVSGETYKISLRPSHIGSKNAVYIGDCANFEFEDGDCSIYYLGDSESEPSYEFTVLSGEDFKITIYVDGYRQDITVRVKEP